MKADSGKKKKIIPIVVILIIIVVALVFLVPQFLGGAGKQKQVTSAQLEKVVNIDQLSTADFIYNGIAEKYKEDKDGNTTEDVFCHIAYEATVSVGISTNDIQFKIDQENKIITPILPDITVNSVSVDTSKISYIPQNPQLELQEVIHLCKEDVKNEAQQNEKLYQTAEENLRNTVEALLIPILTESGYSLKWE